MVIMLKLNKTKYKVYCSDFVRTKDIDKLFQQCAKLIKLNHLLEIGLITKNEYEKIKESIGFVASL